MVARDPVLADLYGAQLAPFPPGLAGEVIAGVEIVLLDDAIAGVASHYVDNRRPLSEEHRALLTESLADLESIDSGLPAGEAREYIDRLGELARYLLATR